MSNLSQFFASDDTFDLRIWIVSGGGGGGAGGSGVAGGHGGGGGIYHNTLKIPLGCLFTCTIGSGGTGGSFDAITNTVFSGSTGNITSVRIYNPEDTYEKRIYVTGGGNGGAGGQYSVRGGDGGCGGSTGAGSLNINPPGSATNIYRNVFNQNAESSRQGFSVYRRKGTGGYNTLRENLYEREGYYGYDAVSSSQAGGVMMSIPELLNFNNVAVPYYSDTTLWEYPFNPSNDIPVVSIPGNYADFNGYDNTGNGGRGGINNNSGISGSSGFVLISYDQAYDQLPFPSGSSYYQVFSNSYNFFKNTWLFTGSVLDVPLPRLK